MRVYKFLDAHFGLKTLTEKRLKISTVDDLNDPFELLPFRMTNKQKRLALNRARKQWGAMRGIICFSSEWCDPVIWAHYSDKHRGLCLGFDIPDDAARKVEYVGKRLSLPEAPKLNDATAWVYTKYDKWSYEKEIRCCTTLDTPSEGLYFMEFGESLKLVEVIAGARCNLARKEILEALRPLTNVNLIKARPGFHRFEIVKDKRGFKASGPVKIPINARVVSTLQSIDKLERYLDGSGFIPATNQHRGQIILALFSKCLTVGRAVCSLVQAGFGEEAFGVTRTLIEIYFDIRYISNKDTEMRAEKFAMFFTKDQEGWRKIIPKYYPNVVAPNTEALKRILETAKNYKNPYDWSGEPQKTRSLAVEPDTYEFDSAGNGTTAEFDYEVFFKLTSHYVHSTVCALDGHIVERGDTFKIRRNWNPQRRAELALFNVLAMTSKIFVCGFRALRHEQPEELLQELFAKMQSH